MEQICAKCVFSVQNKKSEHHYRIHDIQIYLNANLHLIQAILTFFSRICPNIEKKNMFVVNNHCIPKIISYDEIHLLNIQGEFLRIFPIDSVY